MPVRDQGPIFQLGFGVNSRQHLRWDEGETEGANPNSGPIAKALHGHPVMRFFAASAATLAGVAVGGALVKKGGIHLGASMQEMGFLRTNHIQSIRRVQKQLDEWQGVTRVFADGANDYGSSTRLFVRDQAGKVRSDKIVDNQSGFWTTYERQRAAATKARTGGMVEDIAEWTYKDELQKRMVSQARRLHYELPAAWMMQRGVVDPLFGQDQGSKDQVNWHNPVDVMTDFITESTKNLAFMFSPFEAGVAGTQHGWRKLMTYGDDIANPTPMTQRKSDFGVSLRAMLEQVGTDATDLLNKTVKYSSQVTGSFSAGIDAARHQSTPLPFFWHKMRHGSKVFAENEAMDHVKIPGVKKYIHKDILDAVPGPFTGAGTGWQAAKQRWRDIAAEQEAFQEMMAHGVKYFDAHVSTRGSSTIKSSSYANYGEALKQARETGIHPITDLASRLQTVGKGGPQSAAWKASDFYTGQMQNEYDKLLEKQLIKAGVDGKIAHKFATIANVGIPTKGAKAAHMSRRVRVGKGTFKAKSTEEVLDELQDNLGMFTAAEASRIRNALPDAMSNTDSMFQSPKMAAWLDRKVERQWEHLYQKVLPRFADEMLEETRLPYELFDQIDNKNFQYLTRQTAKQTGLNLTGKGGEFVGQSTIEGHLVKLGFNLDDPAQMKAFLVGKGKIAKPWTKEGRNVFGLKPVTVGEALEKGYFRSGDHSEEEIKRVVNRMAYEDPLVIPSYKLGGVYQTASGSVLDFSKLKRQARSFTDKVANEVQIPLVGFKPLETAFYKVGQDIRDRSTFQYVPSMTKQPFVSGTSSKDDFYIWMRSGGKNKGRVFSFGLDDMGNVQTSRLQGEYKPYSTDAVTLAGRHIRLAAGEKGDSPRVSDHSTRAGRFYDKMLQRVGRSPSSATRNKIDDVAGRFTSFFDIERDQNSIFSILGRFRQRETDITNPRVLAGLLRDGEVDTRRGTLSMRDGQVYLNGAADPLFNEAQVANAFEDFSQGMRPFGFSSRVATGLQEDATLDDVLSVDFRGLDVDPSTFTLKDGRIRISDLRTSEQLAEAARLLRRHDISLSESMTQEAQSGLRRAQRSLLSQHIDESSSASYWNRPVHGPSSTIHTRQDQLRADLYKYMGIRRGLIEGDFAQVMAKVTNRLDEMRSVGRIGQVEYTEARAAALSMQLNTSSYKAFDIGQSTLAHVQAQMDALMRDPKASFAREILSDVIMGETGRSEGKIGAFQPFLRRHFGIGKQQPSGTRYNPFGNTGTVFAPTFSTAFQNDPTGAIGSVLGFNSWSNPRAWSGASIPVSHLFGRLNEYGKVLGLGINQEGYRGPLDFYARGMVGKRALPLVAGGATALTLDRTIGGYVNDRDAQGERVYSPFFLGMAADVAVQAQALPALTPGGMSYEERLDQLREGEVPIRSGRFWPLGNTPFMGGRIQYFRPSWYRRLQSGHLYTSQTYGTPMERLLYGYDFSPLRPFDPYRFERQHYEDRPYPVTGEYFTGPWGPLTSVLNMSIGKLLKPQRKMHTEQLEQGLGMYAPVGDAGAFFAGPEYVSSMQGGYGGVPAARVFGGQLAAGNAGLEAAGQFSIGTAQAATAAHIGMINNTYREQAYSPAYGIPRVPTLGITPRIISGAPPLQPSDFLVQGGQLGYEMQELFGIYGFAAGAIRSQLGFGDQDLTPDRVVLSSAAEAYGGTRGFWDLNLGGLGDIPGQEMNIQLSEVIRRFIPKPRTNVQSVNPILNNFATQHPWLPSSGYFIDFHRGDPYTKIQEGEMRLPGAGYERLHSLHPDTGLASGAAYLADRNSYGIVDRHKILGDVAPWSQEYRNLDRQIAMAGLPQNYRDVVETTRSQVAAKSIKKEFTPYKYKYSTPGELGIGNTQYALGRAAEWLAHRNTYFNTKFLHHRTAAEDWERDHVYGATFPEWQHPVSDFVKPMFWKATQRNPVSAALGMGAIGSLFGASPRARVVGGFIGGMSGGLTALYGRAREAVTGDRYIPKERKRQAALEEYMDILTYVKNTHLAGQATSAGNNTAAAYFQRQAQRTMYGANIYDMNLNDVISSVPKRKREHFREMLFAPVQEREQILSTAPRLERRLLQAAWGHNVEARPELTEYFKNKELPAPGWEGWHPYTNMDHVKIKVGQSLGIDMSEMGYYPQQIDEANLVNPSYPDFASAIHGGGNTEARIRQLMAMSNIQGDVYPVYTPYGGQRLELSVGVN